MNEHDVFAPWQRLSKWSESRERACSIASHGCNRPECAKVCSDRRGGQSLSLTPFVNEAALRQTLSRARCQQCGGSG